MSRALILISTCCSHFADKVSLMVEIGQTFARRDNDTTYLLSGSSPCAHIIRLGGDEAACLRESNQCLAEMSRVTSSLCRLEPTEPDEQTGYLADIWSSIEGTPPEARKFSGYGLYDICKASVARRLKVSPSLLSDHPMEQAVRHCIDEFQKDAIRALLGFRRALLKRRPNVVLHFSGRFHRDRCAVLVCREMKIPIVAIESTFDQCYVYWDESGRTGSSGRIGSPRPWPLCSDTIARVKSSMIESFKPSVLTSDTLLRCRSNNSARTDGKTLLFLGQVPYDAALVEDGANFGDQVDAVRAVSRHLVAAGKHRLVIRPHPKAPELGDEVARLHLPNTVIDSSGGLGLLTDLLSTDLAATVCSQSGLQAAWLGKPVVVLGRAFYSNKGFTFDANGNKEALATALSAALAASPGEETRMRACYEYLAYLYSSCMLRADDSARAADLLESASRRAGNENANQVGVNFSRTWPDVSHGT